MDTLPRVLRIGWVGGPLLHTRKLTLQPDDINRLSSITEPPRLVVCIP